MPNSYKTAVSFAHSIVTGVPFVALEMNIAIVPIECRQCLGDAGVTSIAIAP